jgi:leader peptidase (prepilin peptidase) / N-methyltransferase
MVPDALLLAPWVLAALLGLVLGSFLNVVIHRLPLMLEREWQAEHDSPQAPHTHFNLAVPASHCPHCGQPLHWFDNIPLLSYLLLRGRCRHCQAAISWQYPAVELATAVIFVWSLGRHGMSADALAWAGFASALLALAVIDARTTLLPDALTQPLTWAGLLAASTGLSGLSLADALWGAVAGYLFLWSVYWLFRLVTGQEGMGRGDFKLMAALGAWLGWQALIALVMIASLSGLAVGLWLKWRQRLPAGGYIPFGPFLALAGAVLMVWGIPAWLSW